MVRKSHSRHRNTWIEDYGAYIDVFLYDTQIVTICKNKIILNTGGWCSVTTKRRMNQISEEYDLGYHVYAKNYDWYVDYNNSTYRFFGKEIVLERST